MKPSDSFHLPQRQSPFAVIFVLITFLRKSVRRFWFLFLLIFFQKGESRGAYVVGLLVAISVIQLVSSLIHYFRFYFYVEGDELILESRRLKTTRTNIPFDRIQTIEFEQGILHRFFNVVKVKIDTAGSGEAEMNLDALDFARAEALRTFILTQKALIAEESGSDPDDASEEIIPTPAQDELLLELDPSELFRIGLAQNHLRTSGIIIGFVFGLYQYVEEFFDVQREDVEGYLQTVNTDAVYAAFLVGIPVLLISGVILSVVRVFIRNYGFKAWQTARGFKLQAGLFTRREQAASRSKIQLIRWYQTLFELRMAISRVRLFQAAGGPLNKKQALTLPGCHAEHREALYEVLVTQEEQIGYRSHRISKKVILRRLIFRGILPAIALSALAFSPFGYYSLLWLLLIPWTLYTARRYYARYQLNINAHSVLIQSGVWGNRGVLLPWYKTQAVQLTTSPFERRHGLHTVHLATAGGTVKIGYVPAALAREIVDYALYQIEVSERAWM